RGDAALRDSRARIFWRPDHGNDVRRREHGLDLGHGARSVDRRLALRHLRQLLLALYRLALHPCPCPRPLPPLPPTPRSSGRAAEIERCAKRLAGLNLQDFGVWRGFELASIHGHREQAVIPDGARQLEEAVIAEPAL